MARFRKPKRAPMSPEQYKIHKIRQALGSDKIEEMDGMGEDELNKTILSAVKSVAQATEELEANEKYIEAKRAAKIAAQPKKDLEDGLKDLKKRQNALVEYSRHRLAELGKA